MEARAADQRRGLAATIGEVDRARTIRYCRGIVLLGLEAPEDDLEAAFAVAASEPMVKGFAVGRTIFNEAARAWLTGAIDDEAAIADMAAKFARLSPPGNASR